MNPVWMVAALGVAGAFIMLATWWYRNSYIPDLGTVSDQWIAEHRHGLGHDSRR